MSSDLQEQQAPIDRAIADAMVQSVPEEWNRIVLELTRPHKETPVGDLTHALSSPEGFPPVMPVEELFSATYRLDELFQSHGAVFTRAVLRSSAETGVMVMAGIVRVPAPYGQSAGFLRRHQ